MSICISIHAIHAARGKALLAHGGYTFRQRIDEEIVEVVKGLQDLGLDGAECYYPLHTKSQQEKLLVYCRKEGLLISAGNDCHGTFQPETINQIKVCEDLITIFDMSSAVTGRSLRISSACSNMTLIISASREVSISEGLLS